MPPPASSLSSRLTAVRAAIAAAGLDGLLVTHLPNIQYLTGLASTAGAVIVTGGSCRLVVDFRYVSAARESAAAAPGLFEIVAVERTYDETIVNLLARDRLSRIGIESAVLPVKRFNALSAGLATGAPLPLRLDEPCPALVPSERLVEASRLIKDAWEVDTLREAAVRLSSIARSLAGLIGPGRTELDVAADIDSALRQAGFSKPAFETIAASGPNSALPHARPGSRRLQAGDAVVLDFGGVYDGYCVDLTRTVQLGQPSEALRRIYDAVEAAHEAAIRAVRPGIRPSAIDAAARDVLAARGLGEAFGHGTGHGLGLEVHEEPRIGRQSPGVPDDPVEPGMVFTIEPGAYIEGLGGVRIEDDVLVTASGCDVITHAPLRPEVQV